MHFLQFFTARYWYHTEQDTYNLSLASCGSLIIYKVSSPLPHLGNEMGSKHAKGCKKTEDSLWSETLINKPFFSPFLYNSGEKKTYYDM